MDRASIDLRRVGAVRHAACEMLVVPRVSRTKAYAENEVKLMLVEPHGLLSTGREGGERAARSDA
jgi:hypothetical protein